MTEISTAVVAQAGGRGFRVPSLPPLLTGRQRGRIAGIGADLPVRTKATRAVEQTLLDEKRCSRDLDALLSDAVPLCVVPVYQRTRGT